MKEKWDDKVVLTEVLDDGTSATLDGEDTGDLEDNV